MKKNGIKFLFGFIFLSMTTMVSAQLTVPAGSPEAEVTQRVGITDITIHYNRPYVKGRKIWGGLVPYGFNDLGFGTSKSAPWRAGADYNTTIAFTHDVTLEGNAVKAGKYGLFFAVKEDGGVTVILSSNTTSWGSYFYQESEDVLRFEVQSKEIENTIEMLTYSFDTADATSTIASLKWEKKEIPFKIEVAVTDIVMEGIANDLRNPKGFKQTTWDEAAEYAFNAGNSEKALEWINTSISGQFFSKETFANLSLKARILATLGKDAESKTFLDKALPMGTASEIYQIGNRFLIGKDYDDALSVMKTNVKNNKGAWPSNFGLARAYSANGDYKNAIKSLTKSLKVAPANFKPRLEQNIERLKKGEDINTPAK